MITVFRFETARFVITGNVEPEDMDPADSFEFQEDIDAVRNGDVEWFVASVIVADKNGRELAGDTLGGCAYKTFAEFFNGHRDPDPMNRNCSLMRAARGDNVSVGHYFPDMVRNAISQAREVLAEFRAIPLRTDRLQHDVPVNA